MLRACAITPFLVLTLTLIPSCDKERWVPEKPDTVPAEAEWAGGEKGGCWIRCELDASERANRCIVYDEAGAVWTSGLFVSRSKGEPIDLEEITYSFYDGRTIGLLDGRALVPMSDDATSAEKSGH